MNYPVVHTINFYIIDTYPHIITNLATTTIPLPTNTTTQSSSTVTTVSAGLNVNAG